jgi:hypothetical protein
MTETTDELRQKRFVCFDLHDEAVRALQELKVIGSRRNRAAGDYTRIAIRCGRRCE